jgi:hypothetical protein
MSLINIINEKIEKIKPEVILTDLTKNTDPDTIEEFVNSKKKDDRIAIAANPNLTVEQMEKLAGDRANGVKQALCYNKNLPIDIAQKLLDEEPDRLQFIAEYGGSHLDKLSLDHLATIEREYDRGAIMARLLRSPEISDETIKTLIEKYPNEVTKERELFRNKNLSKKAVYMLIDHLQTLTGYTDAALTRITSVRTDVVKESDLKKMDWKNNAELRATIFYRGDLSEKFVIQAIEASTEVDSFSAFRDSINKGNPNAKSIGVLNALMKKYNGFERFSFNHDFNIFGDNKKIPLDPGEMVKLAKGFLTKGNYENYLDNVTKNVAFPDYGLDDIPVTKTSIKHILGSPNIDIKRAEKIIMSVSDKQIMSESVTFAFPGNTTLHKVSNDVKMYILKVSGNAHYWLKYVATGDIVDDILDNLKEWSVKAQGEYDTEPSKWKVLTSLAENSNISGSQVKRILDIKDDIIKEENISSYSIGRLTSNFMSNSHKRPEMFEEIIKSGGSIWEIWTAQGSTYFQYDEKARKVIDEIALNTPDAPDRVLKDGGHRSFNDWVKYANGSYGGETEERIDKNKAKKYLLHFIKTGDDSMKTLLKGGFINDVWLEDPEVGGAMYEMTGDEKYLPQEAKDMFLF